MEPNQPNQQRSQPLSSDQMQAFYQQLPIYYQPMAQAALQPRVGGFTGVPGSFGAYIPTPWYGPQDLNMWSYPQMWQRRNFIEVLQSGPAGQAIASKQQEQAMQTRVPEPLSKPYFTPSSGHAEPPRQFPPKSIKEVRSARKLATLLSTRSNPVEAECSRCREGGALLNCDRCSKSFHLVCAHMEENDVPLGPWLCFHCGQLGDQRYKQEILRVVKDQKTQKEGEVREILSHIMAHQKEGIIKSISERFPNSIKAGRITYPIEDSLLFEEPALHQLILPPPRPIPQPTHIPPHLLGDLLYITDFCMSFSSLLRLSPFSVDMLDVAILSNEETPLMRAILLSFAKTIMLNLLDKEDLSEFLEGTGDCVSLIAELKDSTDVFTLLPLYYMKIIYDCLRIPAWREMVEENSALDHLLEQRLTEAHLEEDFFLRFNYEDKLGILVYLSSCLLSTKSLHEEINNRLEQKAKHQKAKHDLNQEKKTIEAKLRVDAKNLVVQKPTQANEQLCALQNQITELQRKIAEIVLRTEPLGLDRDFNEYYSFAFDRSKVYIKSVYPLDESSKSSEGGYWYVYQTKGELKGLQHSLCQKGIREWQLYESLNAVQDRLTLSEKEPERESTDLSQSVYENTLDKFQVPAAATFEVIRTLLLKTEKKFTKHLNKSKKQWDVPEARGLWERSVEQSTSPIDLREQLTLFASKASTPYRTTPDKKRCDKPESKATKSGPVKFRKVGIRIWTDIQTMHQHWLEFAKIASSCSAVALLTIIYCEVINNYCKKMHLSSDEDEDKPNKRRKVSQESDTEKSSSSEGVDLAHDDECFVCNDGGNLLCCETCPRVAHPKCINLGGIPSGDWYCEECEVKLAIDRSKSTAESPRH